MKRNGLPKKWILGVDNGLNLLRELEKEIEKTSLECCLDKANTYKEAATLIICWTYDLVVLDPVTTCGPKLAGNSHASEPAGCYAFRFSHLIGSLEWF